MTKMEHVMDTVIHKTYILQVGKLLVDYLLLTGDEANAYELGKRLVVHDDSKVASDEIECFTKIKYQGNMKDPNQRMSESIRKNIELHWKHNRHHPEHFSDYHNMTDVDIMEMCCDWYARSKQNKTDFMSFVYTRQDNRFKFDEEFFKKVCYYCELIEKLDQKGDR